MALPTAILKPAAGEVYYPDSEEFPMGETDHHAFAMILLREALQDRFASQPLVYVASNLFLYYLEGYPTKSCSPDVMVVKGVGNHFRRVFKTWEEKAVPCTVFEIASEWTHHMDESVKPHTYARIGVKELFLFDPVGDYLRPRLQGMHLRDGEYEPLRAAADGSLVSRELKVRLVPEGPMLRLRDGKTGEPVLTRAERYEQEHQRVETLAAEVARLRDELASRKPRRNGRKKPS